jgi:hypothetical protein
MWSRYEIYVTRRLAGFEKSIANGTTYVEKPPLIYDAYIRSTLLKNNPRGKAFEVEVTRARTSALEEDAVAAGQDPSRAGESVLDQPKISVKPEPTNAKGEITQPDSIHSHAPGEATAWSQKFHETFENMPPTEIESTVRADVDEAVRKYTGEQYVLKTGQKVDLTRIRMIFKLTPGANTAAVRAVISRTVSRMSNADFGGRLRIDVGFMPPHIE